MGYNIFIILLLHSFCEIYLIKNNQIFRFTENVQGVRLNKQQMREREYKVYSLIIASENCENCVDMKK